MSTPPLPRRSRSGSTSSRPPSARRTELVPKVGIVLGSGLGGLADALTDAVAVPFAELPGWPAASAPGHAGRLLLGHLDGVPAVCLQGRLHLYEGNSERLVVEPVLLMRRLGAQVIVLSNAAGGSPRRLAGGHADADHRPPQPDRAFTADRRERRRARGALSRPRRHLEPAAARSDAPRGNRRERQARGRRLRWPDRADLRDARRGAHAARHGRRRGRDVNRARGDACRAGPAPRSWVCRS